VEFTRQALIAAGADTVWLQKVPVPVWKRGEERCRLVSSVFGSEDFSIAALGMSGATPSEGVVANVIEVTDFDQLARLGRSGVEGRIVFFNRPADNRLANSFAGYGGAVNQRIQGPSEASKLGAVAVIVRSATQALHDFPHTGVTRFGQGIKEIPAVAISTIGADRLSLLLKADRNLKINLLSTCSTLPDTWSYNVIGEIRGTLKPGEYITIGGHLDSWDITEGAHDDAGGCVQAIELIRLFKKLNVRPVRSIRAVMFMNEEMTGTGGRVYAAEAAGRGEIHYAALESDRGVTSPVGFGFDADGERLERLKSLRKYFEPWSITWFEKGGGGSDIGPLKPMGALQIGYMPDTQRYFWYHHSANDTFDKVNPRELQLGNAAIASLIYLLDKFGY
jgi:Zn-dependent M28 family amino/carboxypeptidase